MTTNLQVGQAHELLTGPNKGRQVRIVHIEQWCQDASKWRILAEDDNGRGWWAYAAFFEDNYRPLTAV